MFQELLTSFDGIEEPRQVGKVDHLLIDVLAITVCAVLAHAETFEDIALYGKHKEKWLRRFLELPNGIPSHDTFRRVFMLVEAERFEASFLAWTRAVFKPPENGSPRQIAVDGKVMRRSFDRRKGNSPLHVVSAFATQSGLTLAQRVVAEKSGEVEALLPLLEGLDLTGALISLDALYAQKTLMTKIRDQGADYLIALKKNNKKDHARVVEHFADTTFGKTPDNPAVFDAFEETHGRLTRRRAFVSSDPELVAALQEWRNVRQVIAVENITSDTNAHGGGRGETKSDIRYFLTSSSADGLTLAAAVRNHWAKAYPF
jgi:predicted transposase YbfD/YdcC